MELNVLLERISVTICFVAHGTRIRTPFLMYPHMFLHEKIRARQVTTNSTLKRFLLAMNHFVSIPFIPSPKSLRTVRTLERLEGIIEVDHFVLFQRLCGRSTKITLIAWKPLDEFGRRVLTIYVIPQGFGVFETTRTLCTGVAIIA